MRFPSPSVLLFAVAIAWAGCGAEPAAAPTGTSPGATPPAAAAAKDQLLKLTYFTMPG